VFDVFDVFDVLCGVQCAAEAGPMHLHISFIRQFVLQRTGECFLLQKGPDRAVAGHKHDQP
jgi:hypothetical protein